VHAKASARTRRASSLGLDAPAFDRILASMTNLSRCRCPSASPLAIGRTYMRPNVKVTGAQERSTRQRAVALVRPCRLTSYTLPRSSFVLDRSASRPITAVFATIMTCHITNRGHICCVSRVPNQPSAEEENCRRTKPEGIVNAASKKPGNTAALFRPGSRAKSNSYAR
jgi:hypothetical protein